MHAAWMLFIITALVTIALAGSNELTKGRIADQIKIDADNARMEVFPEAVSFEELSEGFITDGTPGIKSAYKALDGGGKTIGLVVVSSSKGYGGMIEVMTGITPDGMLKGIKVLSDDETPGLGKKAGQPFFLGQFLSRTAGFHFSLKDTDPDVNSIDAVTGATISSNALVDAANRALAFTADAVPILQSEGGD